MEYNDYELVALAQESNEEAINILCEKYKPLIEKKAREVYRNSFNKGIELDDIIQEALIGFEEAINNFDQDNSALFYTFVNLCVDRQLNTLIVRINRDKHKLLNEAVSIDIDKDGDVRDLLNTVTVDNNSPEKRMIKEEEETELINKIKNSLTDFEEEVFDLKLQGFSYKEISNILDKDSKAIDNAIQRIKSKMKNIIK